jgi:hypothetical protein
MPAETCLRNCPRIRLIITGLVSIVGKTIQVRFKGSDEAVFVIKGTHCVVASAIALYYLRGYMSSLDLDGNAAYLAGMQQQLLASISVADEISRTHEQSFVYPGNFLGRSFEFQQNGRVVARCKRHGKFQSATNFLSGEDTCPPSPNLA